MKTPPEPSSSDADDRRADIDVSRPWQIEVYDSIWLLAGGAIVFFVLSYIVWGLVDILTIPAGG